ncbi:MAG: hypothetical protein IJ416_11785 [Ruminiclostridium sp.]|nr:hypothetical protein [Ruminiclostridium sp.]
MENKVFGTLNYDGGWCKKEIITFWKKDCEVKINVSAYENEEPNKEQMDSYIKFKNEIDKFSEVTLKKLKEYMSEIEDDIKVYCNIPRISENIFDYVTIKEILFIENGSFGIMCDCKWDSHGIAVLCTKTSVEVGMQDIVWLES